MTGDISLATLPPGASIYVNGRLSENVTPFVLSELLPGNYNIRLELKKHQAWHATLPVKAGEATVMEKIILLPEEPYWLKWDSNDKNNLNEI